ncbi:hypothetical protein PENTCL1PPCAC_5461 [Pristionchus entomophagus]|uniref:Nanos-type domain-containing protein n=1 Tax=Pristionchus entomophagus TaxID=358040 RepID=A0AAV5SUS4_9BILA|nr:hypothetical protein PENTCL1PPCAC_5461 [Pristionchus entomophagus]
MHGFGGHARQDDVSAELNQFTESRAQRVNARARADSIRLAEDASTASVSSWMEESCWSRASSHLQQSQQHPIFGSLFSPDLVTLNEYPSSPSEGDTSIRKSLRSPGAFGTNADWVGRHLDVAPPIAAPPPSQRPSIEFSTMLPPSSFPGAPYMAHVAPPRCAPFRQLQQAPQWLAPGLSLRELQIHDDVMCRRMPPAPLPPHLASLPPYALHQSQQHDSFAGRVRVPPAFRSSSVAVAGSTRRNSCSDHSNSSRGSSSSRGSVDCSYCRSVNEDPTGHTKHNCPVLAQLPPCRICGARGRYNHTESHCPNSEKTQLTFIPKTYRRRTHSI